MSRERWWVMRTSALGDVVLASGAVRTLRTLRPEADVTMLTRMAFAPLMAWCPGVDRVLTLEDDAGGGDLAGLRALAGRTAPPDMLLDLQGGVRGRLLASAWRLPHHRLRGDGVARRMMIRGGRAGMPGRYWPSRPVVPAWEKMARAALSAAGAPTAAMCEPLLVPPAAACERGSALWGSERRPRVALCAGARGAKRWPSAHLEALADTLAREVEVTVIGDEGPDPVSPVSTVRTNGGRHLRAALLEVAGFLAAADVVVAGDTGLGHVAAALGVRVVSLFGPTTPALGFAPAGRGNRVVERALPCRPCSVHGTRPCWRGDHACLDELAPAEVADAVRATLELRTREDV